MNIKNNIQTLYSIWRDRMKKLVKYSVILAITAMLFGCASMSKRQQNMAVGAAIGGVAGNLIGDDTGATLGGAALGGLIGSQI